MMPQLTVGVVGLGLIGGSMAKALTRRLGARVYGYDRAEEVLDQALADGAIAQKEGPLAEVDLLLLALYPDDITDFIRREGARLRPGCRVIDLCGVKGAVCREMEGECLARGLEFIGGHPMAGREKSGFAAALETLFDGASMILVPTRASTKEGVDFARKLFLRLGFGRVVETTAEHHDEMIAFTSQLAHVVSSCYIKSPRAVDHAGYSAGSYQDLTRVARLNPQMWTELFLANYRALGREIDDMIAHLQQYRDALARQDAEALYRLLEEGAKRKAEIDGD